jgi:hypothetical protein
VQFGGVFAHPLSSSQTTCGEFYPGRWIAVLWGAKGPLGPGGKQNAGLFGLCKTILLGI